MDNLDKIRREIERALNESKEIFEVFNINIRKDVSDGEVDKNERLSEEGGKENIAEENSGIDGILQKAKSLFSNWVNNYLKEPYNEYKKYIFVCLGIMVICLSANYYFQIPKKSDVERYLQKYDVENICIIFNKTMAYGDQYKIARSSAIEALVKIRNEQANKFLDKYILDPTSQDNIKKEILNKYSIFDPQYIDRKIENYRVKISIVNKDASFSEYKKLFDELIKFSNNENSMQKITHALYIESIRFLLNPNMTNEVIEYFNTLSKYKDQSKTIKVIDKYIEQYEYVKKLKNEQSRISSRLDSIREERKNILNKKHSSITGYITSQYDTTSYFFRDAYGLTGVLKTTVTVFTSPGMFTMDVLHIGETKDGFPLFIEDSSRKYDAVKMLELWQEENSLKEELSTMPSKIMSAEDVLAYLRSTLLNLRQEENKTFTTMINTDMDVPQIDAKVNQHKIDTAILKVVAPIGTIHGDEIIVRSKASTLGKQIALLYDNNKVEILGKERCNDHSAAILSVSFVKVSLNSGKVVTIHRGQALTVKRESKGNLVCGLNLDGREVSVELPKNNVHLLQGDIWYKVKTETGVVGYVFSDYIKEEK